MESAVTMAVSPTSMSGTLRSRACGGKGQVGSGPGRPPPASSIATGPCARWRPHLDDVTVSQREHQLRVLLHACAVLQGRLQVHGDHLALGRPAGAGRPRDQRLLPQQPVACQRGDTGAHTVCHHTVRGLGAGFTPCPLPAQAHRSSFRGGSRPLATDLEHANHGKRCVTKWQLRASTMAQQANPCLQTWHPGPSVVA